jgi:hypothetical protein
MASIFLRWYPNFLLLVHTPYIISSPGAYTGPVNKVRCHSCDYIMLWQKGRNFSNVIKDQNQLIELVQRLVILDRSNLFKWRSLKETLTPSWRGGSSYWTEGSQQCCEKACERARWPGTEVASRNLSLPNDSQKEGRDLRLVAARKWILPIAAWA